MGKTLAPLFVWLGFSALSAQASPAPVTQCESFSLPLHWSYCLTTTPGSRNPDLLYYFHGRGGKETEWATDSANGAIRDVWSENHWQAPTVAAVSFGENWLLAERNSKPASGLYEFFLDTVMPTIENRLGGLKGHRLLMGVSMGGFNAAQLLLKKPELFSEVVLACPAITQLSPHATRNEITAFIKRTGAHMIKLTGALMIAKHFFPDEASWQGASPLLLASARLNRHSPALHLSCGIQDEYGFYEGTHAFAEIARKQVRHFQWQALAGGHCTFDPRSIAKFLVDE